MHVVFVSCPVKLSQRLCTKVIALRLPTARPKDKGSWPIVGSNEPFWTRLHVLLKPKELMSKATMTSKNCYLMGCTSLLARPNDSQTCHSRVEQLKSLLYPLVTQFSFKSISSSFWKEIMNHDVKNCKLHHTISNPSLENLIASPPETHRNTQKVPFSWRIPSQQSPAWPRQAAGEVKRP